jgi:hypothetical protein
MNEVFFSCDHCNKPFDKPYDGNFAFTPVNGFDIRLNGGYNEFNDNFEATVQFLMCHDCVVKMFEYFPGMGRAIGKGCHPTINKDNTPCCEWSWTWLNENDALHFANKVDGKLVWEKVDE